MKQFLSLFAIAAMSFTLFTACDDDNDTPDLQPVDVSEGVFVVCSGNQSGAIDGSITYINSSTGAATQNAFQAANGRSLGLTVNDAIVYGSKLYIAVTKENTLEVVDRNTMKSIKQIKTTELMGEEKGLQPRHLVAYQGKVYLSTYGTSLGYGSDGTAKGYVAAIDTASYAATTYQVGAYPEGMAVSNGKLYVANSSYGTGNAPSISSIDLSNGSVTDFTDDFITNPVQIEAIGDALYILDSGLYDASWNQSGQGVRKLANGKVTKVADATMMAVSNKSISRATAVEPVLYLINNPYTYPATPVTYSVYIPSRGETTTFIDGSDIDSPNGISVDPVTGKIYILSYSMGESGYADYKAAGYVNEYSASGAFIKKYTTGVGPTAIAFNTAVKYE